MTLPNAEDGPGFRIAYAVVFGVIFICGIVRFIQTVNVKVGRSVRLTLFGLVIIDGLFVFLSDAIHAKANSIPPISLLWLTLYLDSIYLQLIAYAAQNSIIVLLLFLWIELFSSVEHGVFVYQKDKARKYAIIRNLCVAGIAIISFFLIFIPLIVTHTLSPFIVWFSFVPVALFILPIFFVALFRWRYIFVLMQDSLKVSSSNGDRFIDLTKATLIGILTFVFSLIYAAATKGEIATPDVAFDIFISLIPDAMLPFGVIWYFSPSRSKNYSESPVSNTNSVAAADIKLEVTDLGSSQEILQKEATSA